MKLPLCVPVITVAVATLLATASCSRRVEKNPMRVGETQVLKPMSLAAATSSQKPKHVRLVFDMGGAIVKAEDDVVIEMFTNPSDKSPKITGTPRDYAEKHKITGCPKDVYTATKDAVVGDVLFCNGSLDPTTLQYFVAKRPGKDPKFATNAVLEYEDPATGLASYYISFH